MNYSKIERRRYRNGTVLQRNGKNGYWMAFDRNWKFLGWFYAVTSASKKLFL